MKKDNNSNKLIIGGVIVIALAIGLYFIFKKKPKVEEKKEPEKSPEKIFKDAYDNLQFEFNKDVIKPTSFPFLDEIVDILRQKEWNLKLEGHTDNKGSADYNLKLSKARANSVKKYLEEKGIKPTRIEADGFGSTKPIADNSTEQGREKNRRVEFKVIKDVVDLSKSPLANTVKSENQIV
jgi:outer membrane protein OmpA-like peptidoglycan-associated protein